MIRVIAFSVLLTGGMVAAIWLSYIFPAFGRRVRKTPGPWKSNFNPLYRKHIYLKDALSTIGLIVIIPTLFVLGRAHPYTLPVVLVGLMFLIPSALLGDWIDKRAESQQKESND